ncbi:unnamed protein product [Symbiodinium natans]|uniref:Uncharacterized protein n=1 Tax=Symbiodinium natans TaxID=878477 RepID=A0A812IMY6_9DINO|nr:unnamed protein product [Symbiodinium natans]
MAGISVKEEDVEDESMLLECNDDGEALSLFGEATPVPPGVVLDKLSAMLSTGRARLRFASGRSCLDGELAHCPRSGLPRLLALSAFVGICWRLPFFVDAAVRPMSYAADLRWNDALFGNWTQCRNWKRLRKPEFRNSSIQETGFM